MKKKEILEKGRIDNKNVGFIENYPEMKTIYNPLFLILSAVFFELSDFNPSIFGIANSYALVRSIDLYKKHKERRDLISIILSAIGVVFWAVILIIFQ